MAVTGTRVLGGRYVLGEVLGTGGMATVWQAGDEVLGREVAVTVLSPQCAADPGFLTRFDREAHAAQLSHPRLVTVFDSGIDGQAGGGVCDSAGSLRGRLPGRQAGCLGVGRRWCPVKTWLRLPSRQAMVRWQIWRRVTGQRVTVPGTRRELELLIRSVIPRPAAVTLPCAARHR